MRTCLLLLHIFLLFILLEKLFMHRRTRPSMTEQLIPGLGHDQPVAAWYLVFFIVVLFSLSARQSGWEGWLHFVPVKWLFEEISSEICIECDSTWLSCLREGNERDLLSVRMHLALKAYQELLNCLCAMDQSADSAVRNSSQVIKGLCTDSLLDRYPHSAVLYIPWQCVCWVPVLWKAYHRHTFATRWPHFRGVPWRQSHCRQA